MALCDEVREHCARVAADARYVSIDVAAIETIEPGPPPALDPERHYLDGSREDVADYFLALDAINFGSGWFPTLRKRASSSGYFTVAWGLADRFRAAGPWTGAELRAMRTEEIAGVLGQSPANELMSLYAQALRSLGGFLGVRRAVDVVDAARGSAERFAASLVRGMALFDDRGFHKRAQIAAADMALAGVADFADLDRLTIFADNVVPHVLRCDGVLVYDPDIANVIDAGALLPAGRAEHEIRACAVHACEAIAARLEVPAHTLDNWLWNRGQGEAYKARPRHRTRTVYY